jgi:hypothetical protein
MTTSERTVPTTRPVLKYEADFLSHLEQRFHVSRGTARALLESWMQGLGPAESPSRQHLVEGWVDRGFERLASAEEDLVIRQGARG